MKKILTSLLLIIALVVTSMTTALAAGAPSWKSIFTSKKYNKTFTDKNGIEHVYKCYRVTEGWNKVGTVYYTVYYNDITRTGNVTDYGEKSEYLAYKNACPKYPDAPKYTYYLVAHFRDHDEVSYDYRSGLPKTTPTPKATSTPKTTAKVTTNPTAKPTSKITPNPTTKPTPKPTATSTHRPTATVKPTPSPAATSTASPAPTVTPLSAISTTATVTTSASATKQATATPSPAISKMATATTSATTVIQDTATVTPPIRATPTPTDAPVDAPQTQQRPTSTLLVGVVIALPILASAIYVVLRLRRKRGSNP